MLAERFAVTIGKRRDVLSPSPGEHVLADIEALAETIKYRRAEIICHEARHSEYRYRLVGGAARRLMLDGEGSCSNIDILVPGDVFGFHVRYGRTFAVEALAKGTIVRRYPRWCVDFLTDTQPTTAAALRSHMAAAARRMQVHLLAAGLATDSGRVGLFLLDLSDRLSQDGRGWFKLPVGFDDIADHLGVETLPSILRSLASRGIIDVAAPNRIRILDRRALAETEEAGETENLVKASLSSAALRVRSAAVRQRADRLLQNLA